MSAPGLGAAAAQEEAALQISVAVGGALPAEEVDVLITIAPPAGTGRVPSDICCVIDVSGSMGAEAVIQSASGGPPEGNGLTMLDIAKHGVRTVIKTLGSADRLAVVWFNHTAEAILPLTVMDGAGQERANAAVESLSEGGGTNIWNGLRTGLEALRVGADGAFPRLGHVMLLTDGQTTERAACLPNLEDYRNKYERLPGTVSTFGFGYNIDSELLCWLASAGEATYSFIPDAGFVGTVFVNTMSNLLVTMAREVHLDLGPEEGAEILAVKGGLASQSSSDGIRVSLGTLQYGQSKDVVVRMKIPAGAADAGFMVGRLQYENVAGVKQESDTIEGPIGTAGSSADKVEPHTLRCIFVDALSAAVALAKDRTAGSLRQAHEQMRAAAELVAASPAAGQEFVKALLEDMTGQSSLALSKHDWYWKWGQHYLTSIMFAHKLQQCNNFKDPSVQLYGGDLFRGIQEQADELFNTLPAPTPSAVRRRSQFSAGPAAAAPAAPVNMAAYNDRYGVCVNAASPASLAGGVTCRVGDLRKGDRVLALDGTVAEVVCLVRTPCTSGRAMLVHLPGGAQVTPHHPVFLDGAWRFPIMVAQPDECPCEAVCSVVLQGSPALLVGGVPCVALGHGLEEEVARHPYFGTSMVLDDLRGAPGFESGQVEIQPRQVVRDPDTGLVSAFDF